MLHENPLMLDIDVDHWRNLQTLLLESAKQRRRIVVIHEDGEIQKFVHSHRDPVVRGPARVDDPQSFAETVYRDNADTVEFVAVFERKGFDEYFGRFQASWSPDEDLDEFVQRTYALLDEYPEAIVTYPGVARHELGLQWRVGATHEQVKAAVGKYVPPDSTVVFGIFDADRLWTTLVLHFDADLRADVVTTVDAAQLASGDTRARTTEEIVSWVNRRYPPCSLGLFTSLARARGFLDADDKLGFLQGLAENGELIASPLPDTLPLVGVTVAT